MVAAGAVAIAWARVAAHVHHAQDVVAGLLIGLAAGALAAWLVQLLIRRLEHRGAPLGVRAFTTADRSRVTVVGVSVYASPRGFSRRRGKMMIEVR